MNRPGRRRSSPSSLDDRLAALTRIVELARGRLDDALVDAAAGVVSQAGARMGLGMDSTVVVLAGPTGAGKSTLFNALAGSELARPGHRRPTTSTPTAASWGDDAPDALLDWLQVPTRHRLRDGLDGLVLVDLPDFDSVERAHQVEAERMIALADLTIWVVDPQKYADGVLHEHYLRPLARFRGSMLVVLNQADRLDDEARAACVSDLVRLLEQDGMAGVPVHAVSALTGLGIDALRTELQRRITQREAAAARLAADVTGAVDSLAPTCDGAPRAPRAADGEMLVEAFGAAAGVPTVVDAVARAHRRRSALATGWPYVRWLRRFRPDPLRRLRISGVGTNVERSSMPAPTTVQDAQVDAAIRALATRTAGDTDEPWPGLLRSAALARRPALPAELEHAVSGAKLPVAAPRWWGAIRWLQWGLVLVSMVGALWLLVLAGVAYLQLDRLLEPPDVSGIPVPTAMLLGAALAGLLLAMLAGIVSRFGARRRARTARRTLDRRIGQVARDAVLDPIEAELAARRELCQLLGGG